MDATLDRVTKASPNECPDCGGMGYTVETTAEMQLRFNKRLGDMVERRTIKQGSGCPRCLGTGQL